MSGREWAVRYRSMGFNPLPSKDKRPLIAHARYHDEDIPDWFLTRFRYDAIQIPCGSRWRLVVLDLDGPVWPVWDSLRAGRPFPETWRAKSGGGGIHYYFRVDPLGNSPLPSRRLWGLPERSARPRWTKGLAVELIGDRKLITAPPSVHPTGSLYAWEVGPDDLPEMATMPDWLATMPEAELPRPKPLTRPRARPAPYRPTGRHYANADVLRALPDPVGLLVEWGLRLATDRPNEAGWISCHSVFREDATPSASVAARDGSYWEPDMPGGGKIRQFFEVAALLGRYPDWISACNDLGRIYCGD